MKKFFLSLLGLILLVLIGFLIWGPAWFEKQTNMVDGLPLAPVSEEARALHDSLMIVDLHGDTLLWKRKITDSVDYGHIDLARMQEGNVGLQIFSSVTKTPKGQNYDSNSAETDNFVVMPRLASTMRACKVRSRPVWSGMLVDPATRSLRS